MGNIALATLIVSRFMSEKYYKVISPVGVSPTKEFDYSKYLPKNGEAGAWLPEITDAKIRGKGYYVSKHWRVWYVSGARVFEVECEGLEVETLNGVEKQACCRRMRLLRDCTDELLSSISDERFNKGDGNLGRSNVGDRNIGDYNIGSRNVGNLNVGDFNTGDLNTGIDNVGDDNKGSLNSGSSNFGHSNTGSFNVGSFNSGDYNKGHANTGSFNKGNRNSGKWNACNYSSGFFNTQEPFAVMFNKPTTLKVSEIRLPKWLQKGDLKLAMQVTDVADLEATFALPNFDAQIFEEITGVSIEAIKTVIASKKK